MFDPVFAGVRFRVLERIMRIMKMTIAIIACFVVGAYAGMIEYADNDPVQYLYFAPDGGLCDTNTVDSIQVWVRIDPDSGFASISAALTDSFNAFTFGYIRPDTDTLNHKIPGHYVGEYWYYTITFFYNEGILSPDSVHQSVDYYVLGRCLPLHEVD